VSGGSSLSPGTPAGRLRLADARQQHQLHQQVEMQQLGSPGYVAGPLSPVNLSAAGVPLPSGQVSSRILQANQTVGLVDLLPRVDLTKSYDC
jgi:uncharacterized lipoprotein YajG